MVQSGQAIKEHLFGEEQIACYEKKCPNHLELDFDGYEYSFCKTRGQIKGTNLNELEILTTENEMRQT